MKLPQDANEAICDNTVREAECLEYMVASIATGRAISLEIFGDAKRHNDEHVMLAALIMADVVFINSHWWRKDWPQDAQKTTALCVDCSDVFLWGAADAEDLLHDEIEGLYDEWLANREWGPSLWCIKKRGRDPQKPVMDAMTRAGVWPTSA